VTDHPERNRQGYNPVDHKQGTIADVVVFQGLPVERIKKSSIRLLSKIEKCP
jgi:hypothetical protein